MTADDRQVKVANVATVWNYEAHWNPSVPVQIVMALPDSYGLLGGVEQFGVYTNNISSGTPLICNASFGGIDLLNYGNCEVKVTYTTPGSDPFVGVTTIRFLKPTEGAATEAYVTLPADPTTPVTEVDAATANADGYVAVDVHFGTPKSGRVPNGNPRRTGNCQYNEDYSQILIYGTDGTCEIFRRYNANVDYFAYDLGTTFSITNSNEVTSCSQFNLVESSEFTTTRSSGINTTQNKICNIDGTHSNGLPDSALHEFKGYSYYSAWAPSVGYEIMRTDGYRTEVVFDLFSGRDVENAYNGISGAGVGFASTASRLYFTASTNENTPRTYLKVTDGIAVYDVNFPGFTPSNSTPEIGIYQDKLVVKGTKDGLTTLWLVTPGSALADEVSSAIPLIDGVTLGANEIMSYRVLPQGVMASWYDQATSAFTQRFVRVIDGQVEMTTLVDPDANYSLLDYPRDVNGKVVGFSIGSLGRRVYEIVLSGATPELRAAYLVDNEGRKFSAAQDRAVFSGGLVFTGGRERTVGAQDISDLSEASVHVLNVDFSGSQMLQSITSYLIPDAAYSDPSYSDDGSDSVWEYYAAHDWFVSTAPVAGSAVYFRSSSDSYSADFDYGYATTNNYTLFRLDTDGLAPVVYQHKNVDGLSDQELRPHGVLNGRLLFSECHNTCDLYMEGALLQSAPIPVSTPRAYPRNQSDPWAWIAAGPTEFLHGQAPGSYEYKWFRCNSAQLAAIINSTVPNGCVDLNYNDWTYGPDVNDAGKYLAVALVGTNQSGQQTITMSSTVGPIDGTPKYLGFQSANLVTPYVGINASGSFGNVFDHEASLNYQWMRCSSAVSTASQVAPSQCSAIPGATSATYKATSADSGKYLVIKVTGVGGNATTAVAYSQSTAKVQAAPPTNTSAPTISGSAKVGKKLTGKIGTWVTTGSTTVQWYACSSAKPVSAVAIPSGCSAIAGAKALTFTLTKKQKGKFITIVVTAKPQAGSSVTKYASAATTAKVS
jgi:hypothetical protein